jgi:hypothetical protein
MNELNQIIPTPKTFDKNFTLRLVKVKDDLYRLRTTVVVNYAGKKQNFYKNFKSLESAQRFIKIGF